MLEERSGGKTKLSMAEKSGNGKRPQVFAFSLPDA
jgi:hypothetical protein